jgi:hypothetical protein
MARGNLAPEDADLASMSGAGGFPMAVLWKEAARPERVADDAAEAEPLEAPFDVITYAGPITMAGYERLSELLETRKTHAKALVVLETPGGDPHAAFRIARAIGFHYEECLQSFPPTDQESPHVQGPAEPHDHPGKQEGGARARDGALSRPVRHGPEADVGVAESGRTASDAAPVARSQSAVSDLH